MDLQALDLQVADYQKAAFSLNTDTAYAVHRRAVLRYCTLLGVEPIPATSRLLCRYAAHLAKRLKFSSVKQYLNIVRIIHREWNLPKPLEGDYRLHLTLRGISSLGDSVCRKQPITPRHLRAILWALDVAKPEHAAIWAAARMMFYGLLRKSNALPNSAREFDPTRHLRRSDISFTSGVPESSSDGPRQTSSGADNAYCPCHASKDTPCAPHRHCSTRYVWHGEPRRRGQPSPPAPDRGHAPSHRPCLYPPSRPPSLAQDGTSPILPVTALGGVGPAFCGRFPHRRGSYRSWATGAPTPTQLT